MSSWQAAGPVLMTVDPVGGVWSYALDLCRELDCAVALATQSISDAERSGIIGSNAFAGRPAGARYQQRSDQGGRLLQTRAG